MTADARYQWAPPSRYCTSRNGRSGMVSSSGDRGNRAGWVAAIVCLLDVSLVSEALPVSDVAPSVELPPRYKPSDDEVLGVRVCSDEVVLGVLRWPLEPTPGEVKCVLAPLEEFSLVASLWLAPLLATRLFVAAAEIKAFEGDSTGLRPADIEAPFWFCPLEELLSDMPLGDFVATVLLGDGSSIKVLNPFEAPFGGSLSLIGASDDDDILSSLDEFIFSQAHISEGLHLVQMGEECVGMLSLGCCGILPPEEVPSSLVGVLPPPWLAVSLSWSMLMLRSPLRGVLASSLSISLLVLMDIVVPERWRELEMRRRKWSIHIPTGTWHKNSVIMASKQRRNDVTIASCVRWDIFFSDTRSP